MDTDLDDLLRAAAPLVATGTPALRAALADLARATEAAERKRRATRRAAVGLAATALIATAGVGTAAAAGVLEWEPGGWWDEPGAVTHRTDSPEECRVTWAPRGVRVAGHPVSPRERTAAMTAAGAYLRSLDHSTLDGLTPDAAYAEVSAALDRELERQGLTTYAVTVAMATDCGTEARQ